MSSIGSSISQSVAGADASSRAAARDLASKAGRAATESARSGPDADALIVSPDAIARATAMQNNSDQPSSQRHRTLRRQQEERERKRAEADALNAAGGEGTSLDIRG